MLKISRILAVVLSLVLGLFLSACGSGSSPSSSVPANDVSDGGQSPADPNTLDNPVQFVTSVESKFATRDSALDAVLLSIQNGYPLPTIIESVLQNGTNLNGDGRITDQFGSVLASQPSKENQFDQDSLIELRNRLIEEARILSTARFVF